MTADLQKAILAVPGETHQIPTSPPRKDSTGMVDPAASVGAITAATATNTASCSSPLTVTSLEAAAAAGTAAASKANGVPQVVSQVVPVPELDSLAVPMAKLGLYPVMQRLDGASHAPRVHHHCREEKKMMCIRTPPTEHDNRKLFVGGLPTDVTDHVFLDFFKQFGEVIDSVVMVDRVTKRSRGFGFVTFASESDANSLLTAVPCKTGYVIINGKQCEVKASTPKKDDPNHHHHAKHGQHAIPGMWKSNPPHDNRGYSPRRTNDGTNHQGGEKLFYAASDYNESVDARNFDELSYAQPQYQAYAQGKPMYQPNYQNGYPPYGGAYPSSAVPSSWEASYPAPSQYAPYPSNSMGNNGYYDPYALQYANQYQYENGSPPPGQAGYADDGYYAEGGNAMPDQGGNADGGFEQYPQSYPGNYDQAATVDQYE